jgi:hypothetical protein
MGPLFPRFSLPYATTGEDRLEKTEVRASPLVRHRIRVLLKPPSKLRACINQEKIIRMIRPATIRTYRFHSASLATTTRRRAS